MKLIKFGFPELSTSATKILSVGGPRKSWFWPKMRKKIQQQILSKERLNYELARLKNCGELAIRGISFLPSSKYADLCKDVIVSPVKNQVLPHTHNLTK